MTLTFGTEDHSTQQRRHFKERGGKRRDSRTSPEPQPCRESRENRSVCFCASGFALLPLKWSRGTNLGRRLCCAARGEQGGAGPAQPAACSPALLLVMGSALPRALEVVVPPWHQHLPCLTGPGFHLCPQKGCEYSKKLKRGMIKAPQLPTGGQ